MNRSGAFKLWEAAKGAATIDGARIVHEGTYDEVQAAHTKLTALDCEHAFIVTDALDQPCADIMTPRHPCPPVMGPSEAEIPSRENKPEGGPAMNSEIG